MSDSAFWFPATFVIIFVIFTAMVLAFRKILENLRFERYKQYLKKHGEYEEWERKNENTFLPLKISRNAFLIILPVLIMTVWISNSSSVFYWAFIFLIVSTMALSILEYALRKKVHNTIPKNWN